MVTKPAPHSLTRRAERAKLRQGPAWSVKDALPVITLALVAALTVFAPALLADLGDTVIGPERWEPSIGSSVSSLMLAFWRGLLTVLIGYMLWHTREAPLQQRWAWVLVGGGVCMNYARNIYTGNPGTLSFEVVLSGLCWLVWRLAVRPTIHQRLTDAEARAEAAEAEVARLKGDA